jgi:hypothetical protein
MKRLFLIALLILTGCGKSENIQDSDDLFTAPTLSGSAFKGMIFTGQAPDLSIPTGRAYQYNFEEGLIRALSNGESADAAVFSFGEKVLLFNRSNGYTDFRIISPGLSASISPRTNLDLAPGDPFDAISFQEGKSALLAEPLGGKLRVLDVAKGTLSSVVAGASLAVDPLRPVSLLREGDQLSILHTGVEVKNEGFAITNGSQQIFSATIANSERLSFLDSNSATNVIDGVPLSGSNPSNFLNRKKTDAKILSLCNSRIKSCRSALDIVSGTRITESIIWDGSFKYEFLGQIIDGPTTDQVFALIKSQTSGQSYLAKIDFPTKSIEEIQSFQSERLFGIAFDQSASTLFVGGTKDGLGILTIYRNLKKLDEISLDGVFYRSVFVNY